MIIQPITIGSGGGNWSWMGKNPTKVQTCLNEKVYLKDSAYATWTPTTTNTTLISATNLTAYTSVDFSTYDYIAFYRFHAHYEYTSAINPHLTDGYFTGAYCIYGYSENYNAITNDTVTNATSGSSSKYSSFYVSSSGNNTYGVSVGQGVYMSSLSSPTVSTSSITLKVPTIYGRCNNTYFPTTAAEAVDQNTSYYEQIIELWRVDRETPMNSAINSYIRDMWINGL